MIRALEWAEIIEWEEITVTFTNGETETERRKRPAVFWARSRCLRAGLKDRRGCEGEPDIASIPLCSCYDACDIRLSLAPYRAARGADNGRRVHQLFSVRPPLTPFLRL